MAHGYARRLASRLVLLKGPRTATQQLTGLPLTKSKFFSNGCDLCRRKHLLRLCLQLLKSATVLPKLLAFENSFIARVAPPPRNANLVLKLTVLERASLRSEFHRAPAFGTALGLSFHHLSFNEIKR